MIWAYRILWLIFWPLAIFLSLRSDLRANSAISFKQSFVLSKREGKFDVWFHGASVGETLALKPLVAAYLAAHPQARVLWTSFSPTGLAQIHHLAWPQVQAERLPLDHFFAVRAFYQGKRIARGIIFETEIWPELYHQAGQKGVPLTLINARLSTKSFATYRRLRGFFRPFLQSLKGVFVRSALDAERFAALGVQSDKMHIAGNLKRAQATDFKALTTAQRHPLHSAWPLTQTVVFASTHAPEEALALAVLESLWDSPLRIILVPRHAHRFEAVADLVRQTGVPFVRSSHHPSADQLAESRILLADSLGEMMTWYSLAPISVIGGSFNAVGGHNFIEAVAQDSAVICGPNMANFAQDTQDYLAQRALTQVADGAELTQLIGRALQQANFFEAQRMAARQLLETDRAGLHQTIAELLEAP